MWRAEAQAWLFIGADRVECFVPASAESASDWQISLPIAAGSASALPVALSGLGDAFPRATTAKGASVGLRVWVSSRWLGMLALPWSAALSRRDSGDAYARSQLDAAGFEVTATDTVRIDDGPYRAMRTAVVYPAALLLQLESLAQRTGCQLDAVLPLSVGVAKLAAATTQALAVVEGGRVDFLRRAAGHWTPVSTGLAVEASGHLAEGVAQLWRRQQLRDPSLGGLEPQVLDLSGMRLATLPRIRKHPLSAVPERPALGGLRSVALVAALGIAAFCVFQTASLSARVHDKRDALAAPAFKPAAVRKVARTRDEQQRVASINAAILELNLPIAALLAASQAPKDIRVGLLSMEVLPGKPAADQRDVPDAVLKLTAQAQSGADMARYVGFLVDRRPFTAAYLVNHEISDADPAKPYRFTVEASWHE